MASIQERLQLKRVPLDKWSIREQLCLASAVACSGDQNWMSVSRSLKMLCGSNRPSDWFSQKSCAAQYGKLLENVETPKRKKRGTDKDYSSWNPVETPSESILRKLTHERMVELNKFIMEEQRNFARTKDEIQLVQATTDPATLQEVWLQIEVSEKQREREHAQKEQWLKEREERKLEMERAWRPLLSQSNSPSLSPAQSPLITVTSSAAKPPIDEMDVDDQKPGSSPLLTSLLKSVSATSTTASTPTDSHATVTTPSSRVVAPTITNLLTGTGTTSVTSVPRVTTSHNFPRILINQSLTGLPSYDMSPSQSAPAQSPSQAAPTLSMLLEGKTKEVAQLKPPVQEVASPKTPTAVILETPVSTPVAETQENTSADISPLKDEDQQLMEVFKGLIPDNIDDLADILTDNNAIILNSELLAEAEESILESVDALMANQAGLDMDTGDFEETPPDTIASEPITTAELMEQLSSPSGFHIGPTSTVKGDANQSSADELGVVAFPEPITSQESPSIEEHILDAIDLQVSPKEETVEKEEPTPNIAQEDSTSDLSNDTPLSELLKDKSSPAAKPVAEIVEKEPAAEVVVAAEVAVAAIEPDDDVALDEDEEEEEEEAIESPKQPPTTDAFESDSNDDKCLEIIKREIHGLSGLKDNESSENSNEEVVKESGESETIEQQIPETATAVEKTEEAEVEAIEKPMETEKEDIELQVDAEVEEAVPEINTTEHVDVNEPVKQKEETPRKLSTASLDTDVPLDDSPANEPPPTTEERTLPNTIAADQSITIVDTDDDSIVETPHEDKPSNRSKRDYSRRKPDPAASGVTVSTVAKRGSIDTTTSNDEAPPTKSTIGARMRLKERDRSESPYVNDGDDTDSTHSRSKRRYSSTPVLDSMPNSPASSEDQREQRAWKKSIHLVLNQLAMHKYAAVFQKPIADEQAAAEYKSVIMRPMDLQTLKRQVDAGVCRTTAEFQRDVMLMCHNAIMYSCTDEVTRDMAKQMEEDALQSIELIMETWRKENEKTATTMTTTTTTTMTTTPSIAASTSTIATTTSTMTAGVSAPNVVSTSPVPPSATPVPVSVAATNPSPVPTVAVVPSAPSSAPSSATKPTRGRKSHRLPPAATQ